VKTKSIIQIRRIMRSCRCI